MLPRRTRSGTPAHTACTIDFQGELPGENCRLQASPAPFRPAPKRAWERSVLPRAARDDRLGAPGKGSAAAAPAPSPPPPSPPCLRLAATGRTLGPAPGERAAMCLFSARHRCGHLTSGRAVAKAVLGPGCVEGVIKGEEGLGDRKAHV